MMSLDFAITLIASVGRHLETLSIGDFEVLGPASSHLLYSLNYLWVSSGIATGGNRQRIN